MHLTLLKTINHVYILVLTLAVGHNDRVCCWVPKHEPFRWPLSHISWKEIQADVS